MAKIRTSDYEAVHSEIDETQVNDGRLNELCSHLLSIAGDRYGTAYNWG